FLMNNVHEDEPVVFETRWCLSYLRGPLTRTQIKTLMDSVRGRALGVRGERKDSPPVLSRLTPHASRPMLHPDVPQHFAPLRGIKPEGSELVYAPMLLGASQVRFSDAKSGTDSVQDTTVLAPLADGVVVVDWDRASATD